MTGSVCVCGVQTVHQARLEQANGNGRAGAEERVLPDHKASLLAKDAELQVTAAPAAHGSPRRAALCCVLASSGGSASPLHWLSRTVVLYSPSCCCASLSSKYELMKLCSYTLLFLDDACHDLATGYTLLVSGRPRLVFPLGKQLRRWEAFPFDASFTTNEELHLLMVAVQVDVRSAAVGGRRGDPRRQGARSGAGALRNLWQNMWRNNGEGDPVDSTPGYQVWTGDNVHRRPP